MDNKNDKRFPQQEAPEKNTDNAFVQVGKDGHPVVPQPANDRQGAGLQEAADENLPLHSNP